MGRVYALYVKSGVGLRIAETLCFLKRLRKFHPLFGHLCEDIIGGPIYDTVDGQHVVGNKPLAQDLYDRDSTGNRRLEPDLNA